jgi:hypothetical protein
MVTIMKDEMGAEFNMQERWEMQTQFLSEAVSRRDHLGGIGVKWQDNIKIDLKVNISFKLEGGCEGCEAKDFRF